MREHPSPATDLFDRHERLTQRLALDFADIGIPPAKAIQQAEARVAKMADAASGGTAAGGLPNSSGKDISGGAATGKPASGAGNDGLDAAQAKGPADGGSSDSAPTLNPDTKGRDTTQNGSGGIRPDTAANTDASASAILQNKDGTGRQDRAAADTSTDADGTNPRKSQSDVPGTETDKAARLAALIGQLEARKGGKTGPTAGTFRRGADKIDAAFVDAEKNADPLMKEIGGLMRELIPGVGEVISLQEAVQAFKASYDAALKGDLGEAAGQLGSAALGVAGGIPLAGKLAKAPKIAKRIDHIAGMAAQAHKRSGALKRDAADLIRQPGAKPPSRAMLDSAVESAAKKVKGRTHIKRVTGERANEEFSDKLIKQSGGQLQKKDVHKPYRADTPVLEFKVGKTGERFFRLHGKGNKASKWLVKEEDIINPKTGRRYSADELKRRFALPSAPEFVSPVDVPSGTRIRVGVVNRKREWGRGDQLQYEVVEGADKRWFGGESKLR